MLIPKNYDINIPIIIENDGKVLEGGEAYIKNRYINNDILYQFLPSPLVQVIKLFETELKNQGLANPVAFNVSTIDSPKPNRYGLNYGWHKDYNIVGHVTDPLKLWFTFLVLTEDETDSKFMVAPTKDGPGLWNIGFQTTLKSNMAIGHNMNLGHCYTNMEQNNLKMIYIPWFDAV